MHVEHAKFFMGGHGGHGGFLISRVSKGASRGVALRDPNYFLYPEISNQRLIALSMMIFDCLIRGNVDFQGSARGDAARAPL